jgi:hypothetical protein
VQSEPVYAPADARACVPRGSVDPAAARTGQ